MERLGYIEFVLDTYLRAGMIYKDKYGKTHNNREDCDYADEQYDKTTRSYHASNITRTDVFFGAILMIATFLTYFFVKAVLDDGKYWPYLVGYIGCLAAGWTLWMYVRRIPIQYRDFLLWGLLCRLSDCHVYRVLIEHRRSDLWL